MFSTLAQIAFVLALIPFVLGVVNLALYRRLAAPPAGKALPKLSVLVPARNEEARIKPVLAALLASRGVDFEVVVADDSSTDSTPDIVREFATADSRIRLVTTPALPQGWKGKNHACHFLSTQARNDLAVFLDADVVVSEDGLARIAGEFARRPDLQLLSGFPRQLTGSFWEKLLIPLIHVVLLGYLPFPGVKFTNSPMFATACGQLIAVRLAAYRAVGGHEAIRASMHDGVMISAGFRTAGYRTDLADITDISATRMYETGPQVFAGLMKNAHEGMATPVGLPVWTTLLVGGHVLPAILLAAGLAAGVGGDALQLTAIATGMVYLQRFVFTAVFRQSWTGALLHPLGIAALVALQWIAFFRWRAGRQVKWRDRAYGSADEA